MIDTAKVADLVLLMVDGSFGFEMVCCLLSILSIRLRAGTDAQSYRKLLKHSQLSLLMVCLKLSPFLRILISSKLLPLSKRKRNDSKIAFGRKYTMEPRCST
jgi:hypothetical protein